jgi:hypothetical protein
MSRNHRIVATACLLPLLCLTGCAGAIARGLTTDKSGYDGVSAKAGGIPDGTSRVWVYTVGGGPELLNSMGTLDAITFNDKAHSIAGDTYMHLDKPAGHYTVTTTETQEFFGGHQLGKIRKEFDFESGKEYFLRLHHDGGRGRFSKWPFDSVEKSVAVAEMQKLKHYKDGAKARPVKD